MDSSQVCRTCLAKRASKNLSELKSPNCSSYTEIMLFCLNIQVQKSHSTSTKLCTKCYKKISSFYEFKILALKNDAYFKNQIVVKDEANSNDSMLLNASDVYDECPQIQGESKIFTQTSISFDETKDNLSSSKLFKVDDIKVEIIKDEDADRQSDDELLSVIKGLKYECNSNNDDETKENEPVKRKKALKNSKNSIQKRHVCDECGKTVRNLKEHSKLHLPPSHRKRIPCKLCGKTFSSHNARYKHNKIKHLLVKQSCPICKKEVVNLRQHRLVMHDSSDLPVGCPMCERRFISKSAMEAHATVHTSDRPYECKECEKKFRTKFLFQQHVRSVHDQEKTHLCQYCSKRFFKKNHLQMHIRSHTKEKPYECPECGKCFSTANILKNHRLIHSDIRAFACPYCDMTFVRSGYLRAHLISHTKEKRYPCKYCGFKFGRSDHRKRHEATAHERHLLSVEADSKS